MRKLARLCWALVACVQSARCGCAVCVVVTTRCACPLPSNPTSRALLDSAANCPHKECASTEKVAARSACTESAASVDQSSLFAKYGSINKINVYYASSTGCIKGVKPTHGYDAKNAKIIGSQDKSFQASEADIKLAKGERIVSVDMSVGE
jgi:hypothetical protein